MGRMGLIFNPPPSPPLNMILRGPNSKFSSQGPEFLTMALLVVNSKLWVGGHSLVLLPGCGSLCLFLLGTLHLLIVLRNYSKHISLVKLLSYNLTVVVAIVVIVLSLGLLLWSSVVSFIVVLYCCSALKKGALQIQYTIIIIIIIIIYY